MVEEWRTVVIDGEVWERYEVSTKGNVRSLNYKETGKTRELRKSNSHGYLVVCLHKNKKKKIFSIHRLVASTFIPNPNNYAEVNHIDENKENNSIENLEWCDRKYNVNHGTHTERMIKSKTNHPKISKRVRCIETGIIYESMAQAERETGLSHGNIAKCCKGKLKTCGGYTWEYVD